jgi:aminopeptidase N
VTCGSWQDIWLNEGFATYFEALTEQNLYPWNWDNWKIGNRDYIVSEPDGSVMCTDTNDVGRIFDGRLSYSKGAFVLHMLRWQLGDSLFFAGLRQYLLDPNLAYCYAKTPDLKQHLETVSGQDLTTFFNQWYYNQGYPTYSLSWYPAGYSVNLSISQTQSDPSVSFFEMPVPVEFKDANHDTTVVLFNSFSGQQFNIPLSFTPDQVIFDPELWVLHADDVVTEATEPLQDDEMISVFPNPATDAVQIVYHLNSSSTILITDASGRVVKTFFSNSKQSTVVDLTDFSAGVYYVKLMREGIPVVKKVVKL